MGELVGRYISLTLYIIIISERTRPSTKTVFPRRKRARVTPSCSRLYVFRAAPNRYLVRQAGKLHLLGDNSNGTACRRLVGFLGLLFYRATIRYIGNA